MPLPSSRRGRASRSAPPPRILSETTFSSFTRSPQASLPSSSPLTFELNIPSSPWTGIFYTSPNVVFVYVSRVPRGTRVYGLCYGVSSFEEGEVNSFWRMSLVFFFFFCSNMGRRVFGKFWFFEFSNSTTFSLVKETIRKDKFYEWFRYTRRARCSNRVSHVGCSKFGNTCPDNGSG